MADNGGRRGRGSRRQRQALEAQEDEEEKQSDLAEEERGAELIEHADHPSDEDSGEDLIGDAMLRDYVARPELDHYEEEGVDDEGEFEDMDYEQRLAAEREMGEREVQRGRRRMPQALRELSEGSEDDDQRLQRERHQQFAMEFEGEVDYEDETNPEEEERYLDIEECRGKLKIWILEDRTKNWIKRTFKRFILGYSVQEREGQTGQFRYKQLLSEMCNRNKQSLEIVYQHMATYNQVLSLWICEEPAIVFPLFNEVAFKVANKMYPGYFNIQSEVFVRITNLPVLDPIRDLRQKDLGQLIRVMGVITKRSTVYSQLKTVIYVCIKCGEKKGPFHLENNDQAHTGICANCQSQGPFKLSQEELIYRNFQKIILQESPSQVTPGRVPRQKEVILLADNIDCARPGDEIEVTGIYTHRYDYCLNVKHGFPLFYTLIEANYVNLLTEIDSLNTVQADIAEIKKLSKEPNIARMIINSVAPSIYGHHSVKTALALAMFGGVAKDVGDKHRIRGDINVLLLGDPGTAKSQFLKNVEKTFYRCVYTTGKGASAVGLTASVHRDYSTGEWTLEGGALVLADKGICLIDEFDKMNEHDRTSIHEAMEQQSISISKAGIVTSLQARCSVIAAANPLKGQYDSQLNFHDNVDLTDPILSRFDILCVVKDEVCPDRDDALAAFVINSHIRHHPTTLRMQREFEKDPEGDPHRMDKAQQGLVKEPEQITTDIIPQDLLRKYIMYARQKVNPKIQNIDREKISKFYIQLRQESEVSGGINIAVRHLESVIRMAEANARIHLREIVNDMDVSVAISVMLDSFIQSQKYSVAKNLKKKFSHYITFREDSRGLLMSMIDRLYRERIDYLKFIAREDQGPNNIKVPLELLQREASQLRLSISPDFYTSENFLRIYRLMGNNIVLK